MALAETDGSEPALVSLAAAGVRDLGRTLSAAEVYAVRKALLGSDPGEAVAASMSRDVIVGYVCAGSPVGWGSVGAPGTDTGDGRVAAGTRVMMAVTDHANLTWRSPLAGPNDDRLGLRFPVMTGVYAPDVVAERLGGVPGVVVSSGVVAGVGDDARLTGFEMKMVAARGFEAASSELVPVAILAAHLGWRVAAAVIVGRHEEGDGL